MTKAIREKVYKKYGGRCAYCGREIEIKGYAGRPLHPEGGRDIQA